MPSLFEITDEIHRLDELFDDAGNLDDAARARIDALLCENEQAFTDKADNYAALIKELLAMSEARKVEAQRLQSLASYDAAKAEQLKERLRLAMDTLGVKKCKTARYNIGICGNGGKAPLRVDVKPENLPECYRRIITEADKEAIRAALESGVAIEGCEILERGESLRIR